MTSSEPRSRSSIILGAVMVLAGILAFPARPSNASGPPNLFTDSAESAAPIDGALRSRSAELIGLLSGEGPIAVTLNFFDDAAVPATLDRHLVGNRTIWTGQLPTVPGTSVELAFANGFVSGSANVPGVGFFGIFGSADGRVLISQADPGHLPDEPAHPVGPPGGEPAPTPRAGGTPVIDVMFLLTDDVIRDSPYFYTTPGETDTPKLKGKALRDAMAAWGEARIATVNAGFDNSNIDARARLVYAGKIDYSGDNKSSAPNDTSRALDDLTFIAGQDCSSAPGVQECDPAGHLDEVRGLRNDYGADIVFLVTYHGDSGGIAWLLCAPKPGDPIPNANAACNASNGYGVVDFAAATLGLVTGHELGHLLGGRHDRYTAPLADIYARGHLVPGQFQSLLASQCDPTDCEGTFVATQSNHYSNPDVTDGGVPTGVAIGQAGEADMATHIALSAPKIAAFRDSIECHGKPVTIFGTPFADTIVGTGGPDVIMAFGGNDKIFAGDGNDYVCAGAGNDLVKGGGGKDRIWGEGGHDRLFGNSKRDRLFGQKGNDELFGGPGNDRLVGGPGTDELDGGGGSDDVCVGGEVHTSCETVR